MKPSITPGRTQGAPLFRLHSLWTQALILTLACSHARSGDVAKPNGVVTPTPTSAREVEQALPMASAAREGGTGTRAKGQEGALGRSDAKARSARPGVALEALPAAPLGDAMSFGMIGLSGGGSAIGEGVGAAASKPQKRYAVSGPRGAVLQPAAPPPELNTEAYASVAENAFVAVKAHPLSTFSSDVDTASYSNARRFLGEGQLPPVEAIRVEEWLNYFSYAYAPPTGDAPVAIHSEVSDCPWQPAHRLVRLGIKARPIEQAAVPPRNLVFLIDVSGSMMPANKLPLLKQGLAMLTRNLRPQDRVAMVVYAGSSGLVLPSTPGSSQDKILAALDGLEAGGSTNGGEGVELAYKVAAEHFVKGGINRVVLATDGDFNVGTTSEGALASMIEDKRKTGVFLTVLGFGEGNVKDSTMEMLADKGNGNYAYIDSAAEAQKVLVREAGSTLVTVAKDVKLQVEWNPARVQSYRLIGYENRLLADQDFNDDKKDAGDMGAGHSVTALYEVVPVGAAAPAGQAPSVSPLKYQTGSTLAPAATEPDLLTVSVRYKSPQGNTSEKLSAVVVDQPVPLASSSTDQRFAVAVAEFAQILRGSKAVSGLTLADARKLASNALAADATGDRRELVALIERAQVVKGGGALTRAE